MRGFAATPMIIVVITMIVGFLVIHFLSIDSWIANVITQTSEVHKLQANALKNLARDRQRIYMYAISEAVDAQSEGELKSALLQVHTDNFRVEDVIISNDNIILKVKSLYKENLMSSGIDTCVTSTFYVDYPFRRLIEAANNVKNHTVQSSTCEDIYNEMMGLKNGVEWDIVPNEAYSCGRQQTCGICCENDENGNCRRYGHYEPCFYSYYFEDNYVRNTLSDSYRHIVGKEFSGNCNTKCSC